MNRPRCNATDSFDFLIATPRAVSGGNGSDDRA